MKFKEKHLVDSEFDALFDLPDQEQKVVDAKVLAAQFLAVVRQTLEAHDLNRKDFAALLGTSASWLTQLFRGDKLPSLTMLSRMANVLDIKFDIRQRDKVGVATHGLAGHYSFPVEKAECKPSSEMTKEEKLAILKKYGYFDNFCG